MFQFDFNSIKTHEIEYKVANLSNIFFGSEKRRHPFDEEMKIIFKGEKIELDSFVFVDERDFQISFRKPEVDLKDFAIKVSFQATFIKDQLDLFNSNEINHEYLENLENHEDIILYAGIDDDADTPKKCIEKDTMKLTIQLFESTRVYEPCWSRYTDKFNTLFPTFKELFDTKAYADFTFICSDGTVIPAHRVILAANSPVMKAMLEAPMIESKNQTVIIDDIDGETMTEILRFMYTHDHKCGLPLASKLLYGAFKYQIDNLIEVCIKTMCLNLTLSNLFEYLILADRYDIKDLLIRCIMIIELRSEELCGHEDWEKLDKNYWAPLFEHFEKYEKVVAIWERSKRYI